MSSADVSAVNELQDQYTLTPLSLWGENAKLPERRDVWKPFDAETDPLAEWKTMNRAMTEDPPEPRLLQLVSLFGKIGVSPGQDVDKTDEATKRGLTRAALDGRKLLKDAIDSGRSGNRSTTRTYRPAPTAVLDSMTTFSCVPACNAWGASSPTNPRRLFTTTQPRTGPLSPSMAPNITRMHSVPRLESPKVEAFWSITMYDQTFNFSANPINRYAIGDRTQSLIEGRRWWTNYLHPERLARAMRRNPTGCPALRAVHF